MILICSNALDLYRIYINAFQKLQSAMKTRGMKVTCGPLQLFTKLYVFLDIYRFYFFCFTVIIPYSVGKYRAGVCCSTCD